MRSAADGVFEFFCGEGIDVVVNSVYFWFNSKASLLQGEMR